jgi:glycosyltransferase involved in cell wall biosynthesis
MHDLRRKVVFLDGKMSVVHNGVDTGLFRPRVNGERDILREELRETASTKIVGMVSRFDPVKGHETFLASAAIIVRRRPDVKFVAIGGLLMSDALPAWKTYYEKIMKLYERSALGASVRFLDHRENIEEFMRNLDALVCPSTREAFGLVVPEALACGIPVIVSRGVGALEAVTEQAGVYIAEAGDAEAFAHAIERALDERRGRAPLRLSQGFRQHISLQQYGKQFERIYRKVRPQGMNNSSQ